MDETLRQLVALAKGATPGPWTLATAYAEPETDDPAELEPYFLILSEAEPGVILASDLDRADAEFIVEAWNLLARLAEA